MRYPLCSTYTCLNIYFFLFVLDVLVYLFSHADTPLDRLRVPHGGRHALCLEYRATVSLQLQSPDNQRAQQPMSITESKHRPLFINKAALPYQTVDILDSFNSVIVLLNIALVSAEDKIRRIAAILRPLRRIRNYHALAQATSTAEPHCTHCRARWGSSHMQTTSTCASPASRAPDSQGRRPAG